MAIHSLKSDTGIDNQARKQVAEKLAAALADTYTLQLKTQFYHWNVTGEHFAALHKLFEEQYDQLAAAVDELAERIRALGQTSPGTFREFTELASIKEDKSVPANWQAMVKNLTEAHEGIARRLRDEIEPTQELGDEGTADIFIGRLQAHEKAAWMLRSHLG